MQKEDSAAYKKQRDVAVSKRRDEKRRCPECRSLHVMRGEVSFLCRSCGHIFEETGAAKDKTGTTRQESVGRITRTEAFIRSYFPYIVAASLLAVVTGMTLLRIQN